MVFISSKNLFLFLRYSMFSRFFHFFFRSSQIQSVRMEKVFYKHVLQLKTGN